MNRPSPAGDAAVGIVGHPLDNVVWHALRTTHRHVGEGDDVAQRYPPDIAPFYAVDRLDDSAWAALATLAGSGGSLVLFRDHVGEPPTGWTVIARGVGHQLVAPVLPPAGRDLGARALDTGDVPAMVELVSLTRPGPFGPRTIELGGYWGVFDGERLVAMAGERMRCPGFAEISAVCTHPDARGRGLAAALTSHVAGCIQARGDTAFLHVADGNHAARRVYARLGFDERRAVEFVALRPPDERAAG